MSKRFWNLFLLLVVSVSCFAVPAKRGVFKIITLADGSQVRAELRGDEHVSYWQTEDGRNFVKNAEQNCYVAADVQAMCTNYLAQKEQLQKSVSGPRRAAGEQPTSPIVGNRKGLIVLVNFSDVKFEDGHDKEYFDKVANTLNFSNDDGYVGSVRDYYLAQSDNQLDYTFDIIGPIDLPQTQKYYGEHVSDSQADKNLKAFVRDAADIIKDEVTFSDYDNDGDGEVDNIFFLYAGKQEADGGGEDCIWPHMYYYVYYNLNYVQDGTKLNVYACASELQEDGTMGGVGAICHEFSHCLGLPDLYDTGDVGNYGMGYWDIMHAGSYLGNSFRPCGYTAYEKEFCGWKTMTTLSDDATFTDLKGMSEGGQGYKIYNNRNHNEYYTFEPRTKTGWDASLPAEGLMITHIDYNKNAWLYNTVNNTEDHQRCAIVAADDDYSSNSWTNIANDLFPSKVNRFSSATKPAGSWFNWTTSGTRTFDYSIYNIKRNTTDHLVSFSFMNGTYVYSQNKPEGAVFYESFDDCLGEGGNDGNFAVSAGTDDFIPDLDGWECSANSYGANQCAKFGSARGTTTLTSPSFTLNGAATLTFKACNAGTDAKNIKVSVTSGGVEGDATTISLTQKQWNDCSLDITGNGETTITFSATKRFYLDEILVMPNTDGIEEVKCDESGALNGESSIFNLAGQKVNADYKGVVIKNGKKYYRF